MSTTKREIRWQQPCHDFGKLDEKTLVATAQITSQAVFFFLPETSVTSPKKVLVLTIRNTIFRMKVCRIYILFNAESKITG